MVEPQPWRLQNLWRPREVAPPPTPWYRRLATPFGTPEVAGYEVSEARSRVARRLRSALLEMDVPVFRALVLPMALGLFFSLFSLTVGADLPGRFRAWLPHRTHVVQPGETLSEIAARYGISSWQALYQTGGNARRHPDPNRITGGSELDLPYGAMFSPGVKLSLGGPAAGCAVLGALPIRQPGWAERLCRGASSPTAGA